MFELEPYLPQTLAGRIALFGGIYFAFLGLVLYVLLCGESANRNSPVARVHRFFTRDLCRGGSWIIAKVCGQGVVSKLGRLEQYCCWERNPILQIFYLALILGLFGIVVVASYPELPNAYVGWYHQTFLNLNVLIGLVIFFVTSYSDPGVLTADNVQEEMKAYPIDGTLYTSKQCKTCNIPRPARSKHCRICNRCVSRFDHHCGWMNNCISRRNYRYFIWYLIHHSLLCFYGCYVAICAIRGSYDEQLVRVEQWYLNKYGQRPVIGMDFMARFVLVNWKGQAFGIVVMMVVALMLGGFFLYHSYLALRNTTTNETYKWEDLRLGLQHHFRELDAQTSAEPDNTTTTTTTGKGQGKDTPPTPGSDAEKVAREARRFAYGEIGVSEVNQYSGSRWANIKEVLFLQPANKIKPPMKKE